MEKFNHNKLKLFKFRQTRGPFYRKGFAIVLLMASLPTALLAVATYFVGISQIEREVNRTHQLRQQYMAEKLNDQLLQLEKMVTMWKFNPIFQSKVGDMTMDDFQSNIVQSQDLTKTLLIMSNSSPLLREVRLYLPDSEIYLSALNPKFVVSITKSEIDYFRSLFIKDMDHYWTYAGGYLSFVQLVPEQVPYGYLLAQFDAAAINQLISPDPDLQATAFILKANGDWLDSNETPETESHPFKYYLREEVNKHQGKSGSFFSSWKGEKYAVTYGSIDRTGWMYVSAEPISKLTQPIVNASRILLMLGCIGIIVAVCLSWMASRKLNQPMNRLVQLFRSTKKDFPQHEVGDEVEFIERQWKFLNSESKILHERMESHFATLREFFLFQLLNDHLYLSEDHLRTRMEQYGWDLEGKRLALVVIRLLGFSKLQGRFADGDEQLVTFAAVNVIREIADNQFEQAEVISGQDFTVSLLLMLPEDQTDKKKLQEFSEDVVRSLTTILQMNILVGIAKPTNRLSELPQAFQEVNQSFSHRNIQESNQILDLEQLTINEPSIPYPFAAEKELMRCIRSGDREETNDALNEFLNEMTAVMETEMALRLGMNQLLGTLLNQILLAGYSPISLFRTDLYEELGRLREPHEMARWFRDKIGVYLRTVEETVNKTQVHLMKETIDTVVGLLEENYTEDVSLEWYAERFGISIYKLSAGFKEVTGVNFIDYLTRLRINKSKELLLHSSEKVNDIAFRVGYQPSYYYRVFKKHEGVTPTQYREIHKGSA
ncbi:helix-turn-helix domain-containing protein [Paenibacillus aceris]|uniref:AraC-like DNA-binding protein/HAMP domain-containing protein n=1 Tax=Paenibacillus aceris TaxID=869555 RepID=A0ABS4I0A9_9BACL|nr:helix-turn-helix domain-containing protein [Paenibacillus aceris]MBP1964354.1 AraC-like DNA-binding protein/HAMP domain-containing protein [Paenibacillus aceris]NHW36672.1 AraC family transcriptional regulator [Paenibacillus aceris]